MKTDKSLQKGLIILGMHRSGTSALSGALSELGCFVGKDLFQAQKGVNEKGFFENSKTVALNEKLFKQMRSDWDDPLGFLRDLDPCFNQKNIEHATKFIRKEYGKHILWGMKDPRTSILLPFWNAAFEKTNMVCKSIIMVRDPFEVAGSLAKRDKFSLEKSLILWLSYTLASIKYTDQQDRLVVLYDDLISDPEKTLSLITKTFVPELNDKAKHAASFIDAKLRHHKKPASEEEISSDLIKLSKRLYNLLSSENFDEQDVKDIEQKYTDYLESLKGVLSEHLDQVKKSELQARKLFSEAYHSYWWKLSWPLRAAERIIRPNRD
uniref:sulfotransferase family protein n=1 Tax=Ningiella ruwaisensis TaxID=2364274 RepID=UPI00109F16C5|nr:hypothetical protein [Ningiella ruwaisensis]